jgi:hypothetical protein
MKTIVTTIVVALVLVTALRADVDANHPDLSDPAHKIEHDQNPPWYSKGWHDGWTWASALEDKSHTYSDNCEKVRREKYGDIDQEGSQAETEFSGFMAAAAYVRNHQPKRSDTTIEAPTLPAPTSRDWDGCPGGWRTQEAVKQLVDNSNTCKFDSATEPQLTKYNGKACWLVVVQFRTKNPIGGDLTRVADVYMIGSDPLSIIDARLRD